MRFDLKSIITSRLGENYDLHQQYLNRTLVTVQKTIGFDIVYTHARGAYLYDAEGKPYLDFLSGYSAFNVGRNHPTVKKALQEVLDLDLPNMVQMDCSLLSGLLAEKLQHRLPSSLNAFFFCNSGTEAVEAALKFARAATMRPGFLYLEGSFHGLTLGALSVNGTPSFRSGFTPLLPMCDPIALGDLEALEAALATRQYAAFILEPIQGKGVRFASPSFYQTAQQLCRKYGTLLICDEVQTGLGRTGLWFGFEHWHLEPDLVTLAKSLGGGYVPCGAVAGRREIFQKTYHSLSRCVVHSSTFGRNNLAMAAGLATLHVLEEECLVANAAVQGKLLLQRLRELAQKHSVIKEVRGKGLMIAIEFQEPTALGARLGWRVLHKLEQELFPQMIVSALMMNHQILTQVAGHGRDEIKILPPLIIQKEEIQTFVNALDTVLQECRTFPGPIWKLGLNFLKGSMEG